MNAIATPDHLGILFALAILGLCLFAIGLGKLMSLNTRLEEAEKREVDGSWDQFTEERQARANRATLAQRERWGRSA